MSLTGYLSEYSLAEIFHFVQDGNKTGLLSIEPDRSLTQAVMSGSYYISFQAGRIMSVTTELDNQRLLNAIAQRRWLAPAQIAEIESQIKSLIQPLGLYLKSLNAINTEQLKLLFTYQVIAPTAKLFEVHQGRFKFDPQARLTFAEMTGLSMTAKEAALMGMRGIVDWNSLSAKLPAPESALQKLSSDAMGLKLDTQEFQVWKLAEGKIPISQIAEQIGVASNKAQQISFRLSSIGLVQEVLIAPPQIDKMMVASAPVCVGGGNAHTPVSASFLGNLMGFLKKKG